MAWVVVAVGCGAPEVEAPTVTGPIDSGMILDLPGHSECRAAGEVMDPDACLAVVEVDGRMPTESWYKAGPAEPPDPDPRLDDPEYQWLTDQLQACTCSCCHTARYGGPGVHQWDLDFRPMWIDSASGWSLDVMASNVASVNQFLPTDDPDRLKALIEREKARRDAANDAVRP